MLTKGPRSSVGASGLPAVVPVLVLLGLGACAQVPDSADAASGLRAETELGPSAIQAARRAPIRLLPAAQDGVAPVPTASAVGGQGAAAAAALSSPVPPPQRPASAAEFAPAASGSEPMPTRAATVLPGGGAPLQQTLQQALTSSPAVDQAAAQARVAGYDVLRARSKHWPTVSVSTGTFSNSVDDSRSAQAAVNLWAGGGIDALVSQQRSTFDAANGRLAQACLDTAVQVSDAYLGVVKADQLEQRARDLLQEYGRMRDMVETIARADRGRRSDVDQVATRQELVRLASFDAAANARQARANLERVLGAAARPTADGLDGLAAALVPGDLDAAMLEAEGASPAVAAAQADLTAAHESIKVAKAARWPQLNLVVKREEDKTYGVWTNDNGVGLQTSWNLFNGGSDFYGEQASVETVKAAEARLADARRVLQLDVATAWDGLALARRRSGNQAEQLRAARAVLEANTEQFKFGRRSVLDMLSALSDVNTVLVSDIEARQNELIYAVHVASRTGRLMATLNLPQSSACRPGGVALPSALGR